MRSIGRFFGKHRFARKFALAIIALIIIAIIFAIF